MKSTEAFLILGDQLFAPEHFRPFKVKRAFMAEDVELCTRYKYHRRKLVLYLSAMRHFAAASELDVTYAKFGRDVRATPPFLDRLTAFIRKHKITALHFFEIQDKFFETRVKDLLEQLGVEAREHQTPKFICGRAEFEDYLRAVKKPFMKTFYQAQRTRRQVLLTKEGKPVGGKWSFDEENRKPYRKGVEPPAVGWLEPDEITRAVIKLVDATFDDHPGEAAGFGYPVTHDEAKAWLRRFLRERFADFGPFEDAITGTHDVLFHSVLTPALNTGLLTPGAVIKTALAFAAKNKVPLNSVEGFVRQITGWREFIHGIYRHYSARQEETNFFNHTRRMNERWWNGTTGVAPLDDVIRKANRLGYCHHIERLMIAGNFLLLSQIDPREAHRWFMEMFVDSADWVMGPNVYGMTQFSDGGIFATKPYICGSNYLLKMGDYKRGPWCEIADALYWTFIEDHRDFFSSNPRLSVMPLALGRIKPAKMNEHRAKAKAFRDHVSSPA